MPFYIHRRHFLASSWPILAAMATFGADVVRTRSALGRVIIDNDFAGDPDGLFQLAHHVLCPSVKIPLIIGSHIPVQFGGPASAAASVAKARELLKVMNFAGHHMLLSGAEMPIASRAAWKVSLATTAIVREAMREDATEPLVYAAGASLTELALAWLAEPRIGPRLKLVWIGGREHPGLAYPPPGPAEAEFNFLTDALAAQVIFNESDIAIWQVPRDAYRQMLFTTAEIDDLAASCPLGTYLQGEIKKMETALAAIPTFPTMPLSEVYVLGDSPLVTLTALLSPIQPDPSSSRYTVKPTPTLNKDGTYRATAHGRPMRVYTTIDAGLTFRDMIGKFKSLPRNLERS